jgi:single-strand DNA-binding protein
MSINSVSISGNLTRDPELRAAGQTPVLELGVAVNDRAKNQQTGEWEDRPNFVDCTVFGTRAESLSRFLHKGDKVSVHGKLRFSAWEKDGQKRSKLSVVVDELDFMTRRGESAPQTAQQPTYAPQQGYPQQAPAQPTYAPQTASQPAVYDENIPF